MSDGFLYVADDLNAITADQKRFFSENGYLVLEGFFAPERIVRLKDRLDRFWRERAADSPLVIDCYENYPKDPAQRRPFAEAIDASRQWPYKLNDTHLIDDLVNEFAVDRRLMGILAELLGATPTVCNTLFFERSSEQAAHFDSFYMPAKTPNKMCATWIAVDPVTPDNGPLFYYPKSHLIEPYRFSDGTVKANDREYPDAQAHIRRIIEQHDLEETEFYAKPGDVFVWHAQLLHGGRAIRDMSQTRTSLVTHYWTTLDYPDPADHIDLGEGRLLLRKGHQQVVSKAERAAIDRFVDQLSPAPEHVASAPEGFDPRGYLLRNPDVFRANADPYTHYALHGRSEGRVW